MQGIITVPKDFSDTNDFNISLIKNIVSAYVSNNHVAATELPALIATVHTAMSGLIRTGTVSIAADSESGKPTQVQIRNSQSRDALISFVDGKPYQTLRRHLTVHGLTPDTYRVKFGLPSDYPMVAPSYSERRSSLAKAFGLGVKLGRRAVDS